MNIMNFIEDVFYILHGDVFVKIYYSITYVSLKVEYFKHSKLSGYPASLGFPIIHTLCIIKLSEELVTEVSLTIVTARRRSHSASNIVNFVKIMFIEHAR